MATSRILRVFQKHKSRITDAHADRCSRTVLAPIQNPLPISGTKSKLYKRFVAPFVTLFRGGSRPSSALPSRGEVVSVHVGSPSIPPNTALLAPDGSNLSTSSSSRPSDTDHRRACSSPRVPLVDQLPPAGATPPLGSNEQPISNGVPPDERATFLLVDEENESTTAQVIPPASIALDAGSFIPFPGARGTSVHSTNDSTRSLSEQKSRAQAPAERTGSGVICRDYAFERLPEDSPLPTRARLTQSLTGSPSVASSAAYLEAESRTSSPRVAFAELPDLHRCESPRSIQTSLRLFRKRTASGLREMVLSRPKCELCFANLIPHEEHICLPHHTPLSTPPVSNPRASLAQPRPSRKILIVGSPYDRNERRTATMFSITTLYATLEDKEDLKDAFRQRDYSVHSLVNSHFTREDVMQKVAHFFQDARSGDVRAVVFTGHAHREGDGPVMLIPPQCSGAEEAISEKDWEENIRKHAKPGVVVFSILAHCLGDFMTQELDLRQWHDVIRRDQTSSAEAGPIFVTFSATSGGMSAYESALVANSSRATDHFIYALLATMHNTGVHDWGSFFRVFEGEFQMARAAASQVYLDRPPEERWREDNPQHPCFSASRGIRCSILL
ncbi:hypothetical protein FS749_016240 [Ceratobasidium sp. UAMH 11750]|nr:hypothetical protein FS749_016240 [Ceratobasidium sp. UAMH 11750]